MGSVPSHVDLSFLPIIFSIIWLEDIEALLYINSMAKDKPFSS